MENRMRKTQKSVIFKKYQKITQKYGIYYSFRGSKMGKFYTIFWHLIYTLFEVAC